MRRGTWILAICAIVGLAAGAGLGDDNFKFGSDQPVPGRPTRRRTPEFFSPGKNSIPQTAPAASGKPETYGATAPFENRAVNAGSGAAYPTTNSATPGFFPFDESAGPITHDAETRPGVVPAAGMRDPAQSGLVVPAVIPSPADALLMQAGVKPAMQINGSGANSEDWTNGPRRTSDAQLPANGTLPVAAAAHSNHDADAPAAYPTASPAAAAGIAAPQISGAGRAAAQNLQSQPAGVDALQAGDKASEAASQVLVGSGSQSATLTLEWSRQAEMNVGQECECRLLVKNTGSVAARDVAIDATFPASVRLVAAIPRPSSSDDHLTWNFAEIGPGAEEVIGVRMIPTERGQLQTAATVRFSGGASGQFEATEPILQLAVQGPKEVMLGEPAPQTIVISNPGTGVANNVKIESQIPAGLEHPRGDRLVMEVGSLNPGETRTVTLSLAAVEGGQHIVQISAKADATAVQNAAAEINVIAPSVKLSIDGPSLRYIGRSAKYTLTVANEGGAPSNNVRVLHRVPDGFQFVSADNGGKFDPASMTASWFVGRLESKQTVQLNIELQPSSLGSHVHRAGVITEQGTKASTELTTQVDGTASLVLEIVDRNDPVEVGVETDYEVRIRNEGSKAANNVALACELPNGVQFIAAQGPSESSAEKNVVVFKNLDRLEPGKTAVFLIHVKGATEGNHRFRARLASDSIEEPLLFEELTRFYGG